MTVTRDDKAPVEQPGGVVVQDTGMSLLAAELGYVQLAEPVRFRAGWEQAASRNLRAGEPDW